MNESAELVVVPVDLTDLVIGKPAPAYLGFVAVFLPVVFDAIPVHDALLSY